MCSSMKLFLCKWQQQQFHRFQMNFKQKAAEKLNITVHISVYLLELVSFGRLHVYLWCCWWKGTMCFLQFLGFSWDLQLRDVLATFLVQLRGFADLFSGGETQGLGGAAAGFSPDVIRAAAHTGGTCWAVNASHSEPHTSQDLCV